MGVFVLKYRDTRPILEVELHDPPPLGSTVAPVHNLTGSTGHRLHIWLAGGTRLVRTMTPDVLLTSGILRYTWVATDWDAASSPDAGGSFQVGGLVIGVGVEHRIEYEVVGPAAARLTFPNDSYDTLRVVEDIGQS